MLIRRALLLLPCCLAALAGAAEPSYLEIPPERIETLPYLEVPASPDLGPPQREADFPEIPVDRISDLRENAATVYRDMETGQFDREPMVEIPAVDEPALQLPEPTVIPADQPSELPVNTIPAQRIEQRLLRGEERIFQELATEAAEKDELPPPPSLPPLTPRQLRRLPELGAPATTAPLSVIDSATE